MLGGKISREILVDKTKYFEFISRLNAVFDSSHSTNFCVLLLCSCIVTDLSKDNTISNVLQIKNEPDSDSNTRD